MSGGIDSAALAYWKKPDLAITLGYGQAAASSELRAAQALCQHLAIPQVEINVDLSSLGTGPMAAKIQHHSASTPEWWPFRNQLLITIAGALSIQRDIEEILIGTVATDFEHSDGTQAFVDAINAVFALQEGCMRLSAPAIHLTTLQLVRSSRIPHSVLSWCHSCNYSNVPCGTCRSCVKQITLFSDLGLI